MTRKGGYFTRPRTLPPEFGGALHRLVNGPPPGKARAGRRVVTAAPRTAGTCTSATLRAVAGLQSISPGSTLARPMRSARVPFCGLCVSAFRLLLGKSDWGNGPGGCRAVGIPPIRQRELGSENIQGDDPVPCGGELADDVEADETETRRHERRAVLESMPGHSVKSRPPVAPAPPPLIPAGSPPSHWSTGFC